MSKITLTKKKILKVYHGSLRSAAAMLGVSPEILRREMVRHGISRAPAGKPATITEYKLRPYFQDGVNKISYPKIAEVLGASVAGVIRAAVRYGLVYSKKTKKR